MRYILALFLVLALFSAVSTADDRHGTVAARMDADGVQRADIIGGSYFFKPGRIIVKANVPVELKIKAEQSSIPHDFVLNAPEAGIDISVKLSAEPKAVTFTPKKTGEYEFYCGRRFLFFKSHRDRGMKGVLEVAE